MIKPREGLRIGASSQMFDLRGRFSEASSPNVKNRPGFAEGEYNKNI